MTYRVEKYGADGCDGPVDYYVAAEHVESIDDAADIVAARTGRTRSELHALEWAPPAPGVLAYHDYPEDHPSAYGCGGWVIVPECWHADDAQVWRDAR